MIPFNYFVALSLTLVIIVYGIIEEFYPIQGKTSLNLKKTAFFFLGFSWAMAFLKGSTPLVEILAIICGILTAYLYILFKEKKEVEKTEETEFNPDLATDYIGIKGQVCTVLDDSITKRYIGAIEGTSYRVEFISNDQIEKYDYFQITGFENGQFIGEKITTL